MAIFIVAWGSCIVLANAYGVGDGDGGTGQDIQ
jgi:hypothetical protein